MSLNCSFYLLLFVTFLKETLPLYNQISSITNFLNKISEELAINKVATPQLSRQNNDDAKCQHVVTSAAIVAGF